MGGISDDNERAGEDRAGEDRAAVPAMAFRRERAVAILSEGFARNLLQIEEFERRVSEAHAARTLAELDRLIDDIPEELHLISSPARTGSPREAPPRARELASEEQGVQGVMMSRALRGDWLRSRVVAVRTLMSSTELDFRGVEMPPGEVEIRVACLMSTVLITVPEELPVQADVTPVLGEIKEGRRVRATSPRHSGPCLRITGVAVMSEIKIRAR